MNANALLGGSIFINSNKAFMYVLEVLSNNVEKNGIINPIPIISNTVPKQTKKYIT